MEKIEAGGGPEDPARILHDLNQPLVAMSNFIRGAARLLEEVEGETARRALDALRMAESSSLEASAVAKRLRSAIKSEPGKIPAPSAPAVTELMAASGAHSVYIVDDDRSVRMSLRFMLSTSGIESTPFASAIDFLDNMEHLPPGCLLLDLQMGGMDGIGLLKELARRNIHWPVIVMTGHGDVGTAVEAMKLGAIEFLLKPFEENALLGALRRGLAEVASDKPDISLKARVAMLTGRETDVLRGLLAGLPNREIGTTLGVSHRTVEMHRGNIMKKLQARSLAEALTIGAKAELVPLA
jgi:two-component system response regulator FixJ